MSDGGGGLIDSLTYHPSYAERKTSQSALSGEGYRDRRGVPLAGEAPPRERKREEEEEEVRLERVYVPPSHPVHGPVSTVLNPPVLGDPPDAGSTSTQSAAGGCRRGVSFACDVAQRVIVLEMAEAAGLARIDTPADRSPWTATSYGVGEVLLYALEYMSAALERKEGKRQEKNQADQNGVTVLFGIGGSATNDGGLGALQALGLDIFIESPPGDVGKVETKEQGEPSTAVKRLTVPFRGQHLELLHHVELTPRLCALFQPPQSSSSPSSSLPSASSPGGDRGGEGGDGGGGRCWIQNMYLVCDVENPLVGPHGATFTFGPQKCSPVVAGASDMEDAAVGTVKSTAQMEMLKALEAGMSKAARRVVTSSWTAVKHWRCLRAAQSRGEVAKEGEGGGGRSGGSGGGTQTQTQTKEEEELDMTQACEVLLHGPRGGGAGGMSGFFHYLLGTSCLPGADVVAALQGLRNVEPMPWERRNDNEKDNDKDDDHSQQLGVIPRGRADKRTVGHRHTPRGWLFHHPWDTILTGEGSFDAQSIYSRKTVGRLLEMVVEANAWRLVQHFATWIHDQEHCTARPAKKPITTTTTTAAAAVDSAPLLRHVMVICGRCGFSDVRTEGVDALKTMMLKPPLPPHLERWMQTISDTLGGLPLKDVVDKLMPEISVVALTEFYPLQQAMREPYQCVVKSVEQYVTQRGTRTFHSAL